MREEFIPIVIYTALVVGLGLLFLLMSRYIGPIKKSKQKYDPYECGVEPIDSLRKRFHIRFYLIAALFILFDIETVFLLPWAVTFADMTILAIVEVVVFIGILAIGLLYIIKKKVFQWD